MMAIWQVAIDLADRTVRDDENRIEMFEEHLETLCLAVLNDSHDEVYAASVNENWDGALVHREIHEWIATKGDILNAFSSILWSEARFGHHGAAFENEWSSRVLTKCLERIARHPLRATHSNIACFANRAQGRYAPGSGVTWDSRRNRFETVPWSLENRYMRTPPENSIEIRHWVLQTTSDIGFTAQQQKRVYGA